MTIAVTGAEAYFIHDGGDKAFFQLVVIKQPLKEGGTATRWEGPKQQRVSGSIYVRVDASGIECVQVDAVARQYIHQVFDLGGKLLKQTLVKQYPREQEGKSLSSDLPPACKVFVFRDEQLGMAPDGRVWEMERPFEGSGGSFLDVGQMGRYYFGVSADPKGYLSIARREESPKAEVRGPVQLGARAIVTYPKGTGDADVSECRTWAASVSGEGKIDLAVMTREALEIWTVTFDVKRAATKK